VLRDLLDYRGVRERAADTLYQMLRDGDDVGTFANDKQPSCRRAQDGVERAAWLSERNAA